VKIGIDVDGVLIDFEEHFRYRAEMYDFVELNKNEIIDKSIFWVQDKYNWNEEEANYFMKKYCIELTKNSNIMPGVKEVLELLKKEDENNEFVIISARGMEGDILCDIAKEKLNNENIKFDKYYFKIKNKLEICQKEHIDIMIDDNPNTCETISNAGIKTLYFRSVYGKKLEENDFLIEVNNWGEIYRCIKSMYNTKK
jgi:uncharacterized HAD superfamily protein